jgi:hypothetical protein
MNETEREIVAWLERMADQRGKKTQDGWALHFAAHAIRSGEHRESDDA